MTPEEVKVLEKWITIDPPTEGFFGTDRTGEAYRFTHPLPPETLRERFARWVASWL